MKLTLDRLSVFAVQAPRYLSVLMMAFAVFGVVFGFHPLDTEGGTGH